MADHPIPQEPCPNAGAAEKPERRPRFGLVRSLIAAGIVVVVLAAALALWLRRSARDQSLTELIDLHVTMLASRHPVDIESNNSDTVKTWFAGKLPFTFNLPDLQNTQFKLIGGRVSYFGHNPGAQLLFTAGKHQLSVFLFQSQAGAPFSGTANKLSFNLESSRQYNLRFVIVSDAEPDTVHALSNLLRGAARG